MATVSQQNIAPQHEKISVQLQKEDYLPQIDKALKNLAKNAQIPGFRKGLVPLGHVKKLYGQSVFTDEVLKVAGAKLEQYLVENKAEVFARPIPAETQIQYEFNIANPEDYVFEFEIATKPHFEIPLLKNHTTLPIYKVKITDEMLQEEIEKLQLKAGDIKEADEVLNDTDVVHIDIEEVNEANELVETGTNVKHSLLLKYFTEGTRKLLLNKKVNDTINVKLTDAFDEQYEESILNDLKLESDDSKFLRFTIEKIEHIEKADLNTEMFEKIYPGKEIDTEDKFKEQLKSEIAAYWHQHAKNHLQNDIFEKLVHETDIVIPTNFLKRWMSVGGERYVPMEQVEKEYGKFEHNLRWQLITDKLVEENKLQVSKDEMQQAAKMQVMSYFGQYGQMPDLDASWMEPVIKKQLADKKFADELHNRIITDKLFFTIENQLNLQETEINKEDFMAEVQKPHHHHHS